MQTKARMKHPVVMLPAAMTALQALKSVTEQGGLPVATIDLVELRASQINGCSACVDIHSRAARKRGESDDRLFAVAAWREAPWFSEAERAALALTEALTRLSDRPEAVNDETWQQAKRHYDETALATLILAIATINVWNRLNTAVRQPAGEWRG